MKIFEIFERGENMAKKLVMSFTTALSGTASLSMDEPKVGLTQAEVRAVMDSIVAQNLFNSSTGDITAVKSAEIITTTTETLI